MWVKKAEVIPVECVVRGYLAGSAWREYEETGKVSDHDLPAGLLKGSRLPNPIFTPATKARTGHDENITRSQVAEMVGKALADRLEEVSLRIYSFAEEYLRERGLILADTKFEFGYVDGELTLIDELLTPDSSRYWDASSWAPGQAPEAFDKQFVRDYTESTGWNKEPPGPELPPEVVAQTRRQYLEAYRRITGQELPAL
ncbi:MAG: phosphoribosylaminoimidazolesuccinocarboxamide synthase, partial [Armatimonadetes bacterium]|nr:phosphoribosylaminoimidazolesuccinocarboxamide synthase [Armatimonadota bacterium]